MVVNNGDYSIQLCTSNKFLVDVVTQLYPNVCLEKTANNIIVNNNSICIIESDKKSEIESYIKIFEGGVSKVIFIIQKDFLVPDVQSHNIFFLKKPFKISDLKKILGSCINTVSVKIGDCTLDMKSKSVIAFDGDLVKEKIRLTNKEFDIVCFIAGAAGAVSKGEILKDVFGYTELSMTNTVEVHLHRLKQKLSAYVDISQYIKE